VTVVRLDAAGKLIVEAEEWGFETSGAADGAGGAGGADVNGSKGGAEGGAGGARRGVAVGVPPAAGAPPRAVAVMLQSPDGDVFVHQAHGRTPPALADRPFSAGTAINPLSHL
jgi:hypothetical protein